eukprot:1161397-Pelagomonas_calceolata.AAC.7
MSAKGLESQKGSEAVRVVVRCRPLNAKEQNDGRKRIVDMDVDAGQVKHAPLWTHAWRDTTVGCGNSMPCSERLLPNSTDFAALRTLALQELSLHTDR